MVRIVLLITLIFFGNCKEKDRVLTPSNKDISGLALFVVGDVKTKSTPVKVGESIPEFEDISVGKKSCADLQILNISEEIIIRLKEESNFRIKEKLIKETLTKNFYIQSGEAVFNVKKLKQNESIKVITPTIGVGIRGTHFGIFIDPKTELSKLSLYEGSISVSPSLLELEELGEDIFQATGILPQIEEWKKKSETIIEPGQNLEVNNKITKDFLKKIGWDEIKSKPEVKEFLSKKTNSTLTDEDKNKIKTTLKTYYDDPKNKEKVNAVLSEKFSFSTKPIPQTEINSRVEELKELVAIEKEKLEKSTDKSIPVKERAKLNREILMKRISEITGDDIRTVKLKNGQTIRGVVGFPDFGKPVIVSTPEEVITIPGDQYEDFVD